MAAVPLKRVAFLRGEKVESVRDLANYVGLENMESQTGRATPNAAGDSAEGSGNLFKAGDVLFGKLRPYLAKAWLADCEGVCTTEALVLQPRGIDPRYLRYFLLAPATIDAVDASTSGAKMPRADWDFIGRLSVPVAQLRRQAAIANYLDRKTAAIDALIARKEQLIAELEAYRQAVVREAMRPREGWCTAKLKTLVKAMPKSTRPAGDAVEGGPVPFFVSGKQVKACAVADCDVEEAVVLATGGGPAIHLAQGRFSFSTDCWALVGAGAMSTRFLYFWLRDREDVIGQVGFRGAGIKHLEKGWLLNTAVVFPGPAEQRKISARLGAGVLRVDALIAHANRVISELRNYRASLISEAVTGKLALSD